jgi:hypothetical protein
MEPRATTVEVRRRLKARPGELFATLLDPELLASVRGVSDVSVLTEGPDGPRSAGTVRRVGLVGGPYLVEELVALSAPFRFDYRLRETSVPVDHRFGRIELRAAGDGTEATWTSVFSLPGRFGPLVQPFGGLASRVAFGLALAGLDRAALGARAAAAGAVR